MSVSSINGLPPIVPVQQVRTPTPSTPTAPAPVATDSDGDNDGSGGANITPPVNIRA